MLPVDHDLDAALGVLAGSVLPHQPLGARGQQLELGEIPVEDGQFGDGFFGEGGGYVGPITLEERDVFGGHGHHFTHGSDLQLRIYAGRGVGKHFDALGLIHLETAALGADVVFARQQVGDHVIALSVRGCLGARSLADRRDGDANSRNGGAGGVGYRPVNAPVHSLGIHGQSCRDKKAAAEDTNESCPPPFRHFRPSSEYT